MSDENDAARWRFIRSRLFIAAGDDGRVQLMVKDAKSRPPAEVAEPYGTVLDPGYIDLAIDLWMTRNEAANV
jgi:hypothetical protein